MKPIITFIISLFLIVQIIPKAEAIPAFARKYGISCKTCHTPSVPKTKGYGDDFAASGFKLNDYKAPRYFIETGDQELSLIRDFPIAVRLDGYITYNQGNNERPDFSAPFLVKLMSGGALSEKLAYYFYFYMDEHSEVAGVEDAFLMYDNLFGAELDIYLGQFQASDPMFKRELRLSLEDYQLYTSKIGLSDVDLKYDKGIMFAYGFSTGTDVTIEILNGNGLPEPNDAFVFDKDKYKNLLGRVSQSIGDVLRIGGVAYYGKEEMSNSDQNTITNTLYMVGPDATLSIGEIFEMNVQYLYRNDDNIYLTMGDTEASTDITTQGMLGEIIYSPQGDESRWYALAMANYVDSDFDLADYKSATLHLGYLLRRNVRLASEYTYNFTNDDNKFGSFSLGFTSAF